MCERLLPLVTRPFGRYESDLPPVSPSSAKRVSRGYGGGVPEREVVNTAAADCYYYFEVVIG